MKRLLFGGEVTFTEPFSNQDMGGFCHHNLRKEIHDAEATADKGKIGQQDEERRNFGAGGGRDTFQYSN